MPTLRSPSLAAGVITGVLAALAAPPAAVGAERSLAARCEAEVVELHRFLEEWSNAELADTDEAFARFAGVIAPQFLIIDPDGSEAGREPIVDAIRRAHGRWREAPGRIRIENFRLLHAGGGLAVATYEEWHDLPGGGNGRLSSVVFGDVGDVGEDGEDAAVPNGLVWLHLHEVWLETAGDGEPSAASDRP